MSLKIDKKLIKKHILDIGTFHFYENFIIAEMNANVNLDFESGKELFQLAEEYYKNIVPYVYISNRINSYSIKPTAHYKLNKILPNFKGYAIVVYDDINYEVSELETLFTNRPTCIFDNLDDAIKWAEELIIPD